MLLLSFIVSVDVEIGFSEVEMAALEGDEPTLSICVVVTMGTLERNVTAMISIDPTNTQGSVFNNI